MTTWWCIGILSYHAMEMVWFDDVQITTALDAFA